MNTISTRSVNIYNIYKPRYVDIVFAYKLYIFTCTNNTSFMYTSTTWAPEQEVIPTPKVDSIPVFFASLVPRLSLQATNSETESGNEDTILLDFQERWGSA